VAAPARHALLVTGALARKLAAERIAGVLDAFSSAGGVDVFGAFGAEPAEELDSYVSGGLRNASGGVASVSREEAARFLNASLAALRAHPRVVAFDVAEMSASPEGLQRHPRLRALVPGFPYAHQSPRFAREPAGAVRLLYNFFNLLRAWEMMSAHAAAHNISYELVARARPDVDFLGARPDLDAYAAALRRASGRRSLRAAAAAVHDPALLMRAPEFPLFAGGALPDAALDAVRADAAAAAAFVFVPEQQANGGWTDHLAWGPAAGMAHYASTALHIDAIMREPGGYLHAETLTMRGTLFSVHEANRNRAAAAAEEVGLVLFKTALKYCVKYDNCPRPHAR
jgi:hypothetical protein